MNHEYDLLIASGARLYSLGVDLEGAVERLSALLEQGEGRDNQELRQAYETYTVLSEQWKSLERQHLQLREELLREREDGA